MGLPRIEERAVGLSVFGRPDINDFQLLGSEYPDQRLLAIARGVLATNPEDFGPSCAEGQLGAMMHLGTVLVTDVGYVGMRFGLYNLGDGKVDQSLSFSGERRGYVMDLRVGTAATHNRMMWEEVYAKFGHTMDPLHRNILRGDFIKAGRTDVELVTNKAENKVKPEVVERVVSRIRAVVRPRRPAYYQQWHLLPSLEAALESQD